MAFEMASTNLVLELGLIVLVLLGWQFTLAEFLGSPLMVLLFRMFLGRDLLEQAKDQVDKGIAGRMEGHAEMDMSVAEGGSLWQRMTSDRGLARQAQRFLSVPDQINNLFYFRRDHVTAAEHRASRTQKFQIWAEICGIGLQ